MALAASYAMVGVAIALLAVYGADVAAAKSSPDGGGGGGGEGFLPFDHMARGLGLGLPSMALPIAAFLVSRKEPSRPLGALLAAAGVLIIVGGAVVLAMPPPPAAAGPEEPARNAAASAAPLLAVGSLIIALGAIKVRRS